MSQSTGKSVKHVNSLADGWVFVFFDETPRRIEKVLKNSDIGKKVCCRPDWETYKDWKNLNDARTVANDLEGAAGTSM